jgi:RNA polymerase sigma-70 factor (ECF subfamily)
MHTNLISIADAPTINRQALAGLYEQHSSGIFRYAYRLLGDQDLAEECVAETFSRFLQALHTGQGPNQNVQAYLYRVAHNWITDHYRRQPPVVSLDSDEHHDPESDLEHMIHKNLERERVRSALQRLPDEQRRVIVLRLLEQWSHEQVAGAIVKSVEATRALQSRALTSLRRMLIIEEASND